jgi:hypothetical protein
MLIPNIALDLISIDSEKLESYSSAPAGAQERRIDKRLADSFLGRLLQPSVEY